MDLFSEFETPLIILHPQDVLKRPAEEFGNDESVESLWAMKAFEHYEVYFNVSGIFCSGTSPVNLLFPPPQLLCSANPRELRLTPFDDQIYSTFRQDFPQMDVRQLDEDEMKSPQGKELWRTFIYKFDKLDDYNFLTLIRQDVDRDATQENSILVVRIQFLAIEIARNREGMNDRWFLKTKD